MVDMIINDIDDFYKKLEGHTIDVSTPELKNLAISLNRLTYFVNNKIKSVDNNSDPKIFDKTFKSRCYVCKTILWENHTHSIYTWMCTLCGNINIGRRDIRKDMTGKVAIVTGGRIKIGFETAIRLLRNNCKVIITTRFVDDTLERYKLDPDYSKFKNNLTIYQLNMLNNQKIREFIKYIYQNFPKIDYLINNAAQTIKRPSNFFQHLIKDTSSTKMLTDIDLQNNIIGRDHAEFNILFKDDQLLLTTDTDTGTDTNTNIVSKVQNLFPINEYDSFGQQKDLRTNNSWMLELDHVDIQELSEVYIINSIVPFILCSEFKKLMTKTKSEYSWIINVTSMEGVFSWKDKPTRHPHTNMAKAGLNMMTRTCGKYYKQSNIVMVAVDTGWNNPQQPLSYDVVTPVDCADGAARILDPIYRELKEDSILYKDYNVREW